MRKTLVALIVVAVLAIISPPAHAWVPNGLKWPTNVYTVMLSGFGDNWVKSCNGLVKKHTGIDLSLSAGAAIYATYWGTVQAKFWSSGDPQIDWGYAITISHGYQTSGNWWTSTYHHIDPVVNAGDTVKRGQLIGFVHYTSAFPTHLHFGVRDSAYSNIGNAGALPQTACGGYPAFPEYFKNPWHLSYMP